MGTLRTLLLLTSLAVGLGACGTSEQIYVSPPRPAVPPQDEAPPIADRTSLSVVVHWSEQAPVGVSSLRFRVAEVWLKPQGEDWQRRRTQAGNMQMVGGEPGDRTVLTTNVPLGSYEQVALLIDNVRAEYEGNAGGALGTTSNEPIELTVPFTARENESVVLRLEVNPAASIWQDNNCRWYFAPLIIPSVAGTQASAG